MLQEIWHWQIRLHKFWRTSYSTNIIRIQHFEENGGTVGETLWQSQQKWDFVWRFHQMLLDSLRKSYARFVTSVGDPNPKDQNLCCCFYCCRSLKKKKIYLCLVHVIFDVLKLSSNLESLLSFKYSAEKIPDQKEYKSLLLSFEV